MHNLSDFHVIDYIGQLFLPGHRSSRRNVSKVTKVSSDRGHFFQQQADDDDDDDLPKPYQSFRSRWSSGWNWMAHKVLRDDISICNSLFYSNLTSFSPRLACGAAAAGMKGLQLEPFYSSRLPAKSNFGNKPILSYLTKGPR
jgi:hypothetical protein